jgi:hypothetical protein
MAAQPPGYSVMITRDQKVALRARGYSDNDIANMLPADAHEILMKPDERAVRSFLEAFVGLSLASLSGHAPTGVLQMIRKHPNDNTLVPTRHCLDNKDVVDHMTRDALVDSANGHNCYLEARLVQPGLSGKARGGLTDTVCVFALVVDSDSDKAMAWTPPAGVRPTLSVQTSPNNHQFWFFFRHALAVGLAQQLGADLRRVTGGDSDTGNPCQPYRIPGTTNFPDKVKIARGRVITPTLFLGA